MVTLGRWAPVLLASVSQRHIPAASPLSALPILVQPRPSSPVQDAPDKPVDCQIRLVRFPTLPRRILCAGRAPGRKG
ncbi:hypothetical protein PMIN01_04111 [Paraphaeosphaeria minitans]|uniref:Uncharacterized protein n=1 Tax=Paraphaeosphaeria minitans TaxID=565426 RepID=A0A9P6GNW0_9PLEO|nr:hypothetical protein PMIN01_04111 [Paraphaeosphaeria minitans]